MILNFKLKITLVLGGVTRYKVPQNIDMQDRILGPLTMVQFIYAVVGGGFCYAIYMSPIPKPYSFIIIVPVILLVIALDFLKVNERPFLDFLLSIIEFSSSPRQRLWHHEDISDLKVEIYQPVQQTGPKVEPKTYTKEDINALANKLDKPR